MTSALLVTHARFPVLCLRNATQRKSFTQQKVLRTADAATALAASPQANRNDFYFPHAVGKLDQSEMRLLSTNGCGTAAAVRSVAYCVMLENAHYNRLHKMTSSKGKTAAAAAQRAGAAVWRRPTSCQSRPLGSITEQFTRSGTT